MVLLQERSLDVELRELGLTVRAQILIAKAAHDLVVAIEARHHEQLLEDLRRLREREEFPRMCSTRHEVVAGTLRCRLGEHRRLEIDKPVLVEKAAHRAGDGVTQAQTLRHHLAAQIDVAVLESDFLVHLLIELERQGLGAIEELELAREHFHLT